jgi:hypothetical protein
LRNDLPELDSLHEERQALRSLWPFRTESTLSRANWYKTVRDPKPTRKYVGKAGRPTAELAPGQSQITSFAREPDVNPFAIHAPVNGLPSRRRRNANPLSGLASKDSLTRKTVMRILAHTNMNFLQVHRLVTLANSLGLDAEGEIDPSLTFGENKSELLAKAPGMTCNERLAEDASQEYIQEMERQAEEHYREQSKSSLKPFLEGS